MTVVKEPISISIADYLAGEELSDVKHEYLGGSVHAMDGRTNRHSAFSTNALPEIEADLPIADLYERIDD